MRHHHAANAFDDGHVHSPLRSAQPAQLAGPDSLCSSLCLRHNAMQENGENRGKPLPRMTWCGVQTLLRGGDRFAAAMRPVFEEHGAEL